MYIRIVPNAPGSRLSRPGVGRLVVGTARSIAPGANPGRFVGAHDALAGQSRVLVSRMPRDRLQVDMLSKGVKSLAKRFRSRFKSRARLASDVDEAGYPLLPGQAVDGREKSL